MKGFIGLAELQYLIDMDARAIPCIEYAECHHLAWCIGRVTAVRPGSLAPSHMSERREEWQKNNLYPAWKGAQITRGAEKGRFIVKITFPVLETNSVDSAKQQSNRTLTCEIMAPRSPGNLWMSTPYLSLTIALRQQILVGTTTVVELLYALQTSFESSMKSWRCPLQLDTKAWFILTRLEMY